MPKKVDASRLRELGFSEALIEEAVEREKTGLLDMESSPDLVQHTIDQCAWLKFNGTLERFDGYCELRPVEDNRIIITHSVEDVKEENSEIFIRLGSKALSILIPPEVKLPRSRGVCGDV